MDRSSRASLLSGVDILGHLSTVQTIVFEEYGADSCGPPLWAGLGVVAVKRGLGIVGNLGLGVWCWREEIAQPVLLDDEIKSASASALLAMDAIEDVLGEKKKISAKPRGGRQAVLGGDANRTKILDRVAPYMMRDIRKKRSHCHMHSTYTIATIPSQSGRVTSDHDPATGVARWHSTAHSSLGAILAIATIPCTKLSEHRAAFVFVLCPSHALAHGA